ncbi:MAG: hypothetical protein ACYC3A_09420 [Halothiobacillus sp.]
MNKNIDEIHARIQALQEELEGEYRKSLDAFELKRGGCPEFCVNGVWI